MANPLVVAHRGGRGLAPENTLAACRIALALGVDAIEIDVRLTADGEAIVIHDATFDRTTSGRGPVAALSARSSRELDATVGWPRSRFGPEPPPLLGEVLAFVGTRAAVHVELKGEPVVPPALVERVVALLDAGSPRARVLSFDWDALRLARRLAPDLSTEALLGAGLEPPKPDLRRLASQGTRWLGLRYQLLDPRWLGAAHAAKLRLNVWTVNRKPSFQRALRLGVHAITTDRPDRLIALLASLQSSS